MLSTRSAGAPFALIWSREGFSPCSNVCIMNPCVPDRSRNFSARLRLSSARQTGATSAAMTRSLVSFMGRTTLPGASPEGQLEELGQVGPPDRPFVAALAQHPSVLYALLLQPLVERLVSLEEPVLLADADPEEPRAKRRVLHDRGKGLVQVLLGGRGAE